MNVENAKYVTDENGNNTMIHVTIDGQSWGVPINNLNRHYQAILEWVAEGNTIEEAD